MRKKTFTAAVGISGLLVAGAAHAALVVSTAPTQNVSCVAAVCTASAADAVLNARDLLVILKRHNTTIVSGGSAMDIAFDTPVHWTAATRLTLDAYRSITVAQPLISMGHGGMAITVNDGGSGGDLLFAGAGRIAFWDTTSSLRINGVTYRLVGDIATLKAQISTHHGGHYAFADNYDASVDGTYSQSPVGNFSGGTFEGLGNTISHLSIDGCCSLFYLISGSTVRDIVLRDEMLQVSNIDGGIGGVVGSSYSGSSIIGVSLVGGSISLAASPGGKVGVGGVAGTVNSGQVIRSHSSAQVACEDNCDAGGLVGMLLFTSVTQSSASGPVTAHANSNAGGLIGEVSTKASVSLSFATGAVSVGDASGDSGVSAAGGLVGLSSTSVDQCYATGGVSGGARLASQNAVFVGGLIGKGIAATHSYATGSASVGAGGKVGGFAGEGWSKSMVQNYSTGLVSGEPGRTGGFVGVDAHYDSPPVYNYWDLDTSGVTDPSKGAGNVANDPGVAGLTTPQFQSGLPGGFDSSIWGQSAGINNGLPYLLALPPQ